MESQTERHGSWIPAARPHMTRHGTVVSSIPAARELRVKAARQLSIEGLATRWRYHYGAKAEVSGFGGHPFQQQLSCLKTSYGSHPKHQKQY